jgi:protein SCO1/2
MPRIIPRLVIAVAVLLAACAPAQGPVTDIRGAMPALQFAMTRANDGRNVSAESYRGKAVVLYFGYTNCPDICPTTLSDLASALKLLGPDADKVRVLFVSVDPHRDNATTMKAYVNAFAPQIDGLLGSDDALARLTRRYRVTYEVTPASPGHAYEVMHSDSVFFFDADGQPRFVATSVRNTSRIASVLETIVH